MLNLWILINLIKEIKEEDKFTYLEEEKNVLYNN